MYGEATGRVEHQRVEGLKPGRLKRTPGDIDRLLTGDNRQGDDAGLLAKHPELFLSGRAGDVERRHHHLLAALLGEPLGDLGGGRRLARALERSEEHTSELQSLMRHSYAVFCLKKKKQEKKYKRQIYTQSITHL